MAPHVPAHEPLVGAAITRGACVGGGLGVVVVTALCTALIVLSGRSMDLLGVAALAAVFGGAGFGSMLGGVLAAVAVPRVEAPAARPCRDGHGFERASSVHGPS